LRGFLLVRRWFRASVRGRVALRVPDAVKGDALLARPARHVVGRHADLPARLRADALFLTFHPLDPTP